MKNKLIILTENLAAEGFNISEMEMEQSDLIRIKFDNCDGLEIIVNNDFAKIEQGKCSKDRFQKLSDIVKLLYTLRDEIESIDNDIFNKLLNAS